MNNTNDWLIQKLCGWENIFLYNICYINSYAGGIDIARQFDFEIDFMRYPYSGLSSQFFIIILKFIFKPIFVIKIDEKNSGHQKFYFQSPFGGGLKFYDKTVLIFEEFLSKF